MFKTIFKSKRFIAFSTCCILFIVLIYTTSYQPLEIASGLAILGGLYIGAESIKPSKKVDEIG